MKFALKSEFEQKPAHTILACVSTEFCRVGLAPSRIQCVKTLIDAAGNPLHPYDLNDAGAIWHCRTGHTANSASRRFADWVSLDYLGKAS